MKLWWTSSELARLGLPGLWKHQSHIGEQAKVQGWKKRPHPDRKNAFQYFLYTLPEKAMNELLRREKEAAGPAVAADAPPVAGLLDGPRHSRAGRPSVIESDPKLQQLAINALRNWPDIKGVRLADVLRQHGFAVSEKACVRWMARFEAANRALVAHWRNPDAARSRFEPAFGSLEGGIVRPNQVWEIDATQSDVMLKDGRCTIYAVIDVYSRRGLIVPARGATRFHLEAVFRHALLTMGVPEQVKTDNGAEFVSAHFQRICATLGVELHFATPFRPQEKGFVERFIGTFNGGWLPMMESYVGANVAQRQAIRSRKSFAEQRERGVQDVPGLDWHTFTRWVQGWVHHYNHTVHSVIGMTPIERLGTAEALRPAITDERALDVLLQHRFERAVTKRGIEIDGWYYRSAALGGLVGNRYMVSVDPTDVGRAFVFSGRDFVGEIECPDLLGLTVEERDARQRATAKGAHATHRAMLRQHKAREQVVAAVSPQELAAHNAKAIEPPAERLKLPPPEAYQRRPEPLPTLEPPAEEPAEPTGWFDPGIWEYSAYQRGLPLPAWLVGSAMPRFRAKVFEVIWKLWDKSRCTAADRAELREWLSDVTRWDVYDSKMDGNPPPAWLWEEDGLSFPGRPKPNWKRKFG